jgi:hypothetical protein
MDERSFYFESQTAKPAELNCPHCKTAASYELQWMLRKKKDRLPGHADERDKARFAKAQSYMVLQDDKVACSNLRCRKRFDISGIKTMAFLSPEQEKELAGQKPQRSERSDRPERRRDNRQDNRQNNRNRPKQKAGGRGQKAGKRNAKQGGDRNNERSGNRAEEPNGNRIDYPGGNHFDDQRGNRFDDQRGNRAGGQNKRRQQPKGKKKRPEVYFPSDYVNYRP